MFSDDEKYRTKFNRNHKFAVSWKCVVSKTYWRRLYCLRFILPRIYSVKLFLMSRGMCDSAFQGKQSAVHYETTIEFDATPCLNRFSTGISGYISVRKHETRIRVIDKRAESSSIIRRAANSHMHVPSKGKRCTQCPPICIQLPLISLLNKWWNVNIQELLEQFILYTRQNAHTTMGELCDIVFAIFMVLP